MAIPLLTIKQSLNPQSDSNHGFSFEINIMCLLQLQHAFEKCPTVLPMLFMTPGKNEVVSPLLQSIIASTDAQLPPEEVRMFCSETELPELTFIVWPHPVVFNNQHLLLIRMWKFEIRHMDPFLKEAIQKALVCILSITAYSFIFTRDKDKSDGLDLIDQTSTNMLNMMGLCQAHIISLNYYEDEDLENLPQRLQREMYSFHLIRDLKLELIQGLLQEEIINRYLLPRVEAMRTLKKNTFIMLLTHLFDLIVRTANADFDYETFTSKNLKISDPLYEQHAKFIEDSIKQQSIIQNATAIKFLGQFEDIYSLNEELIPRLIQTYNFKKETVVLILIGRQGIGKSTLLNKIIQECTLSSSPQSQFIVGNSVLHITYGGHLLSHPLFIPETGHQLMLADLQGLNAIELETRKSKTILENLVSSLFTIASVPCIFIDNNIYERPNIEKYIERLCYCTKLFATRLERVIFLFHDKGIYKKEK